MEDKVAEIIKKNVTFIWDEDSVEGETGGLLGENEASAEIHSWIREVGEKYIEELSSDENLLIKGVHEIIGVKELLKRLEG